MTVQYVLYIGGDKMFNIETNFMKLIIILVAVSMIVIISIIDPLFFAGLALGVVGTWFIKPKIDEWQKEKDRIHRVKNISKLEARLEKLKEKQ